MALINGTSNADTLVGTASADVISGFEGNDILRGNGGDDTLDGGAGNDWAMYNAATGPVTVTLTDNVNASGASLGSSSGADGADTLISIENIGGSAFADTLTGNSQRNWLRGNAGNDTLNGAGGDDTADYKNATGSVTVTLTDAVGGHTGGSSSGADGVDTLIDIEFARGGDFADTLTGNSGNNFFWGGLGADTIKGGAGSDWAGYDFASGAVTATLTDAVGGHTGGSSSGADGVDTLTDIENLSGGAFADTLTGNAERNWLRGNAGNDTLNGGGGDDTADYKNASGSVTVTLTDAVGGHTGGSSSGADGADTLIDIEFARGGDLADTLTGNSGKNFFWGGLGADTINGGAGNDWAGYDFASGAVTATLTDAVGGHTGGSSSGADGVDTLIDIENLSGSDFNDTLTGNSQNNWLRGGKGADVLNGGGQDSSDWLSGAGDWADYKFAETAVTVNLANAALNTGEAAGDTYISIESVRGGDFNDTLTGNSGNNGLRGGLGNDTLDGGAGSDRASYYEATGGVTVTLTDVVSGHSGGSSSGADGVDTLIDIENITGGAFNDTLTGNSGANMLDGWTGDDTINGGAGADTAQYSHANGGVTVTLTNVVGGHSGGLSSGADGVDTLIDIENILGSKLGDTLTGNSSANVLTGDAGNDTINGGAGNDTVLGGAGDDTMDGGAGVDILSYSDATAGVTVSLAAAAAQNTGGSGLDTIVGFENLTGSAFGDTLTGSSAANTLIGGAGNDTVSGGLGDDLVQGGAGNDTMDGGAGGFDTLSYVDATAAVTVSLAVTAAQATGGGGTDTISNFENLTGSKFNDNLTGDAGNNVLTGGLGNDVLNGGTGGVDTASYADATAAVTVSLAIVGQQNTVGSGLDTLSNIDNLIGSKYNDALTGDAGDNVLTGGLGNDVLNGGTGGVDTASYADATVGVTVNLAIVGQQNTVGAGLDTLSNIDNLTGSKLADTLTGDAANNVIVGGAGRDVMTGGGGNDRFSLLAATDSGVDAAKSDVITDFNAGDLIDLSLIDANTTLAGNAAFSSTIVSAFTHVAGQLQFTTFADPLAAGGVSGLLSGDVNGDGTADFAITLRGVTSISAGSIVL
jgi:Ca2+-binding RTX toxin-like protein